MGMIQAPMLAAASGSDVDFMVHGLIPLNFFGHKVWIATTHVTTLIIMLFIMVLALIARRSIMKDYEKPSGLANAVELVVEMLDKLVKSTMGKHWKPFANYIGSIMFFIFIANTSGLFGLRAPTADYGTTLSLALITFVMIQYSAFKTRKFRMFYGPVSADSGAVSGQCHRRICDSGVAVAASVRKHHGGDHYAFAVVRPASDLCEAGASGISACIF